jgi:hypothetical protein
MFRSILSLLIGGMLSLATAFAQPDTLWTQTYGGSGEEKGWSVQQTTDGGFIITGDTYTYGAGISDVYLIKTDSSGDTLWTKTFGGSLWEHSYSVQQTLDGGYIIAGSTQSFSAGFEDFYLIKTDSLGNEVWSQVFGGGGGDDGRYVRQTSDGGYVMTGRTMSYGAGYYDVWLIKTDESGNLIWSQTYGGGDADEAWSVQQTSDGGYIIAGSTVSYGAGSEDVYLIKTDESGNQIWSQTFGGSNVDNGYGVVQTSDGYYLVTGYTRSFGAGYADLYLIKTDESGNPIWEQTFGGSAWEEGFCVQQTSDGNYIIVGCTFSYGVGAGDVYLIKTDESGNQIWSQTFGGTGQERGYCVQQISGEGYVIAGYTGVYPAYDVYLICLEPEGGNPEVSISLTPLVTPIQIPATGGSFDFNIMVTNNEVTPVTFSAWTDVTLPNSAIYGPILGPVELTLSAGASIDRDRTQAVPANAPAGMYTYNAYVGDNLGIIWEDDYFEFEKLTVGDGFPIGDWASYGEEFGNIGGGSTPALRSEYTLMSTHPNPFNPSTVISYQLAAISQVNLAVYDIAGKKVAELVDGWRNPGLHEVTFDATALASGVYLYRLDAGEFQAQGKMLLVK